MTECRNCGKAKDGSEFYAGHRWCKPCHKARAKANYEANKAQYNFRAAANTRRRTLAKAGVAEEPSSCAACGAAPEDPRNGRFSNGTVRRGRALALDHDHVTGAFRGFLCHQCNAALGLLEDDPALIEGLLIYLLAHRTRSAIA